MTQEELLAWAGNQKDKNGQIDWQYVCTKLLGASEQVLPLLKEESAAVGVFRIALQCTKYLLDDL